MINRDLKIEIERLNTLFSVIVVTGPRQSGKTTLCKQVFASFHYVDLDNVSVREQIRVSPKAFLEQYAQGLIIDEAQQYPELFSYLKVVKKIVGEDLVSTQVIYDGEMDIHTPENGMVNFRNVKFE